MPTSVTRPRSPQQIQVPGMQSLISSTRGDLIDCDVLSEPATPKAKTRMEDLSDRGSDPEPHQGRLQVQKEGKEKRTEKGAHSNRAPLCKKIPPAEPKKAAALHTRFCEEEGQCHEHFVNNVRRQGKSLSMIRHLKERKMLHSASNWIQRLRKEKETSVDRQGLVDPAKSLVQKYGRCGHVLGRGAFGTVRIAYKTDAKDPKHEQLFAVKELKQRPEESEKRYHKRLNAEYCISSSLHHLNVVATLDLLQDPWGVYCQIMEYCPGGDLHTIIAAIGQLQLVEANCFFKQLMQGVEYMHEMGVAHRDLKPENLLLTERGTIKITDFGNAECFRAAWETHARMSAGVCGSAPYIAPEEYVDKEFDPRAVDIWACGIIYLAMRTGEYLWRVARVDKDVSFKEYVADRKTEAGYEPIERLGGRACRNVIYSTIDPSPTRRLTAHQVMSSEWMKQIKVCHAGTLEC
ncbi:serine/threonine-protein kinase HAL4/sat4 [Didymella heteroderae]|uniref:non-specific serine/threonine protein kinase n=1 Tax=Didymella heteroderae TaxID=1769908 RepID=A0A9P5BXV4_9PLEO|nr:serine/threonine-protein kinase HAL4/sat4 [Didymella heteroderae]